MCCRIRKKLVIIGDEACGKTSLLTVFSKGTFPEAKPPRVRDSDFADIKIDNTCRRVRLALWDTAGKELESYQNLCCMSEPKLMHACNSCSMLMPNYQRLWIPKIKFFVPIASCT